MLELHLSPSPLIVTQAPVWMRGGVRGGQGVVEGYRCFLVVERFLGNALNRRYKIGETVGGQSRIGYRSP